MLGISKNTNLTIEFIEKFPYKKWWWNEISSNPNIPMEIIEKYPKKPCKWRGIPANMNSGISSNPNITIEFIDKYIDKICFRYLSGNKFTYQNKISKRKEGYWLLQKAQALNRIENLVILEKYM